LINELWIREVRGYNETNKLLREEFIPWYNFESGGECFQSYSRRDRPGTGIRRKILETLHKEKSYSKGTFPLPKQNKEGNMDILKDTAEKKRA